MIMPNLSENLEDVGYESKVMIDKLSKLKGVRIINVQQKLYQLSLSVPLFSRSLFAL